MKFTRSELQKHLRRIHTDGELSEVALNRDLSADAVTPDHSLIVDVPGPVEDEEDGLPEVVAVIDLGVLIQALGLGSDPEVTLELKDKRLVIDDEEEGTTSFLTADPDKIGTNLDPEAKAGLFDGLEGQDRVTLGERLIDSVSSRQDLLGALEIRLDCGPEGTTWVIGAESGHHATYRQDDLQTDGEEYSLVLQANTLTRIFNLIPDGGEADIVLTGPDSIVAIEFEGHTYMMNPMAGSE